MTALHSLAQRTNRNRIIIRNIIPFTFALGSAFFLGSNLMQHSSTGSSIWIENIFLAQYTVPDIIWLFAYCIPVALRWVQPKRAGIICVAICIAQMLLGAPFIFSANTLCLFVLSAVIITASDTAIRKWMIAAMGLIITSACNIYISAIFGPVWHWGNLRQYCQSIIQETNTTLHTPSICFSGINNGKYFWEQASPEAIHTHIITELYATLSSSFAIIIAMSIVLFTVFFFALWKRAEAKSMLLLQQRNTALQTYYAEKMDVELIAERARIARDMHDIIAHTLSIVIVQADAGRFTSLNMLKQIEEQHDTEDSQKTIVQIAETITQQCHTASEHMKVVLQKESDNANLTSPQSYNNDTTPRDVNNPEMFMKAGTISLPSQKTQPLDYATNKEPVDNLLFPHSFTNQSFPHNTQHIITTTRELTYSNLANLLEETERSQENLTIQRIIHAQPYSGNALHIDSEEKNSQSDNLHIVAHYNDVSQSSCEEEHEHNAQQSDHIYVPAAEINHTYRNQALTSEQQRAVYRIMQEALTNIRKYATASQITVEEWWSAQDVTMQIRDNGHGTNCIAIPKDTMRNVVGNTIDSNATIRQGFGLWGIIERVQGLQGDVAFESAIGQGFTITFTFPLNQQHLRRQQQQQQLAMQKHNATRLQDARSSLNTMQKLYATIREGWHIAKETITHYGSLQYWRQLRQQSKTHMPHQQTLEQQARSYTNNMAQNASMHTSNDSATSAPYDSAIARVALNADHIDMISNAGMTPSANEIDDKHSNVRHVSTTLANTADDEYGAQESHRNSIMHNITNAMHKSSNIWKEYISSSPLSVKLPNDAVGTTQTFQPTRGKIVERMYAFYESHPTLMQLINCCILWLTLVSPYIVSATSDTAILKILILWMTLSIIPIMTIRKYPIQSAIATAVIVTSQILIFQAFTASNFVICIAIATLIMYSRNSVLHWLIPIIGLGDIIAIIEIIIITMHGNDNPDIPTVLTGRSNRPDALIIIASAIVIVSTAMSVAVGYWRKYNVSNKSMLDLQADIIIKTQEKQITMLTLKERERINHVTQTEIIHTLQKIAQISLSINQQYQRYSHDESMRADREKSRSNGNYSDVNYTEVSTLCNESAASFASIATLGRNTLDYVHELLKNLRSTARASEQQPATQTLYEPTVLPTEENNERQ